jgi:hypothetical protein
VKPFERKQLLERVEREGATVGHAIPEEISLNGETLRLRAFVFETKRVEAVSPNQQARVEEVLTSLRGARQVRKQRLETDALSLAEAEELADEIVGIDRALTALESLDTTDLSDETQQAERADRKRWIRFLKRALGHDDGGRRGARR